MNANRPDLKIIGGGIASGGSYNRVKIEGVAKIDSSLDCEKAVINGMATVRGEVRAALFDLTGKATIDGDLYAMSAGVEGHMRVRGNLQSESVKVSGVLKLNGHCMAERFTARGGFEIGGILNAGDIDIILHGLCEAAEISGERIEVRKTDKQAWNNWLKWISSSFSPQLKARVIEGEEVLLESATAQVVRGNRIIIGSECTIDRVEYRTELIIHPNAVVAEQIQI